VRRYHRARVLWNIEYGGDPQDVTVTTEGEATTEGFARMNAEFVAHERFRPGLLVLLDHTHLLVDKLNSQDVRTISRDFVRHDADLGAAIVALVAPTPVQFGLARMSTLVAEPTTSEVQVFYTRPEALEWLRQVREGRASATT
jgi:hypothetical protein